MVPGNIVKVFVAIFFQWLCEWVWPSSKFYFAIIIQTHERRNTWRFYLETSLAARYLLQQIFNEKSVIKGEESIPSHVQSNELIGWSDISAEKS